ncbi:MAG: 4-alpha-glucanotransferase [Deltaproteobacteria bacterium]|nr:4-alpha-glucanotransferase [Deltaproteobacteria bacterium]
MAADNTIWELARLYGVQTSYFDIGGVERHASEEGLRQILNSLGAGLEGLASCSDATIRRRRTLGGNLLPPVVVHWDGEPGAVAFRLPVEGLSRAWKLNILTEDGSPVYSSDFYPEQLPDANVERFEEAGTIPKRMELPDSLVPDYYRLELTDGHLGAQSLLVKAPSRAPSPAETGIGRAWGGFLPLYSLGSGSATYTGLGRLGEWIGRQGGAAVATLPLLPTFMDKPFDPSPYAPVSRLFWNEIYIDAEATHEYSVAKHSGLLASMAGRMDRLRTFSEGELVDWREAYRLQRELLEPLSRILMDRTGQRRDIFEEWRKSRPDVADYAAFRAAMEKHDTAWWNWPESARNGQLLHADYDPAVQDYYIYAQWISERQLGSASESCRKAGVRLYLDLPVGVHPDGYDAWKYRNLFATGIATGAPPDPFFMGGQNWGFSPMHPEQLREAGYAYWRAVLQHHFRHAKLLRIDHVMAMHRLYWIPQGAPATEGVYVRYEADEFQAITALEAKKQGAVVIGEDLGTVPDEVRSGMERRSFQRLYVMQFACRENAEAAIEPPLPSMAASFNTHDLPPFAAFWSGSDIERRLVMGHIDESMAGNEREQRARLRQSVVAYLRRQGLMAESDESPQGVLRACLQWLAASPAWLMLINLEDLWGEEHPQNTPGTQHECPNWSRRSRLDIGAMAGDKAVMELLALVNRIRNGSTGSSGG